MLIKVKLDAQVEQPCCNLAPYCHLSSRDHLCADTLPPYTDAGYYVACTARRCSSTDKSHTLPCTQGIEFVHTLHVLFVHFFTSFVCYTPLQMVVGARAPFVGGLAHPHHKTRLGRSRGAIWRVYWAATGGIAGVHLCAPCVHKSCVPPHFCYTLINQHPRSTT